MALRPGELNYGPETTKLHIRRTHVFVLTTLPIVLVQWVGKTCINGKEISQDCTDLAREDASRTRVCLDDSGGEVNRTQSAALDAESF